MTIRKLFLLSTIAASLALTACGGGDGPTATSGDVAPVTVVKNSAASAAIFAALAAKGASVVLAAPTAGLPAGTLKFTPKAADAGTDVLSNFELTTADGKKAVGVLSAGSCVFTPTSTGGIAGLTAGTPITINPCALDLNTAGALPGVGSAAASLVLGTTTVSAGTVDVTVTPNPATGGFNIAVGGVAVGGTITTGAK
jgi:hypothetical protein